ncbi:MAG: RNA methyltransferase [Fibrobacter sp.]|nr:RNA methyltransferase [Fibrobacter sp.]
MERSLKWYKSLAGSAVRRDELCFLLDGRKNLDIVIAQRPELVLELLVQKDFDTDCEKYGIPVRTLERHQIEAISPQKTPQGILALVRIPKEIYSSELPSDAGKRILLLEHIQDPGNVGTLIRTAAAFDIAGVILSDQCADPFSPKVVQSTAGSLFSVWIRRTSEYLDCIAGLRKKGYKVFSADVHGSGSVNLQCDNQILALGSEGRGLTSSLLGMTDVRFRIPMNSQKAESLNVAVSGGIVMYAATNGST